jgi:site-specific recombinase
MRIGSKILCSLARGIFLALEMNDHKMFAIGNWWRLWREARHARVALDAWVMQANPSAPLAERNLWVAELGHWIRQRTQLTAPIESEVIAMRQHVRIRYALQRLERDDEAAHNVMQTLASVLSDNDPRSLFVDIGMSPRAGLGRELISRLQQRFLPVSPNHAELSTLFSLLFTAEDVEWIAALDRETFARIESLFRREMAPTTAGLLRAGIDDSLLLLCNQIASLGLSADVRARLDVKPDQTRAFTQLAPLASELVYCDRASTDLVPKLNQLRASLSACRGLLDGAYDHLERFGVSVAVVFNIEQSLRRIARVEQLLTVWSPTANTDDRLTLLSSLVESHIDRTSIASLLSESYSLLGKKVVERSAETGEHYIARTRREYFSMLRRAGGGGAVTAFTVYGKFWVTSLGLSRFVEGFLLFLDYAISFLVIHFAHFTLATKQPAMTGPALAARLDDVADEAGREAFVEETIALIRSQMAAVIGNLSVVFPVALAIQWLAIYGFERPIISPEKAAKTLESFSLLGPTPLYAALTGVLLWLSSLAAGWADNWFALHRLRDAIAYQRRLHFAFGASNASRIAQAISNNVAGVSAKSYSGSCWVSFRSLRSSSGCRWTCDT